MNNERKEDFERCINCDAPIISGAFVIDNDKYFHGECYLQYQLAVARKEIARLEQRVSDLTAPYIDPNTGTAWTPPTAWAYARVCQQLNGVRYDDVRIAIEDTISDLDQTYAQPHTREDIEVLLIDLINKVRQVEREPGQL